MTRNEARALLDNVRNGMDASESLIIAALRETGDIGSGDVFRSHRPIGSWERPIVPSMLRPAEPFDALQVAA